MLLFSVHTVIKITYSDVIDNELAQIYLKMTDHENCVVRPDFSRGFKSKAEQSGRKERPRS
jgi:hypothetical protein